MAATNTPHQSNSKKKKKLYRFFEEIQIHKKKRLKIEDLRTNPSQEGENDANQGADHTPVSGDEFGQDFLSFSGGPILKAKLFKEALNGLIQEFWADSKIVKTKMGPSDNQDLVYIIKAIEGVYHTKT
jgi:hypothetical protein